MFWRCCFLSRGGAASPTALSAVVVCPCHGIETLDCHRWYWVANQFLDRLNRGTIVRHSDGERTAFQAGAPGAADAVNVVLGVVRHIEVEHVR